MMYKMPIGNYKWMSKSEIEQTDLATLDVMGDYGFIAEVDLEVSNIIHTIYYIYIFFSILLIYIRIIEVFH